MVSAVFDVFGGDCAKWFSEEVIEDLWDGHVTKIGDGVPNFIEISLGDRFSDLFFKSCEHILFKEETFVLLNVLLAELLSDGGGGAIGDGEVSRMD